MSSNKSVAILFDNLIRVYKNNLVWNLIIIKFFKKVLP